MGYVDESHASVDTDEGEESLSIPARALHDTAMKTFGATAVECHQKLVTGKPATCLVKGEVDGEMGPETFTAYAVHTVTGKPAVLFTAASHPFSPAFATFVQRNDVRVTGLQFGTSFTSRSLSATETADYIDSVFTSEQAALPWKNDEVEHLTCRNGLAARSGAPAHCSASSNDLKLGVAAYGADYWGSGAEGGLLVLVIGTD